MARLKNALRGHFIAPLDKTNPKKEPAAADYLELARFISSVTDDTDETTDDTGYYDGDGTPETTVTGVSGAYSFEGSYEAEDAAQAFVASLKYKLGDERKVWHRVVSADGTKQWVGLATISAIIAGSGDATEYEDFSCTITYNQIPVESAVPAP